MKIQKVNLKEKFDSFSDHWNPRIAGELNGQMVKLAKASGEFVWHKHATEDELFLVLKGHLKIKLREGDIDLHPGEFVIIPHGLEHCPVAMDEVEMLLFEPGTTLNTGDQPESDLTKKDLNKI